MEQWTSFIRIDFEKAFDPVHREVIWQILRHYGVLGKNSKENNREKPRNENPNGSRWPNLHWK